MFEIFGMESEQHELDQEVMDLKDEHEDLEIEKERQIKKQSKNAFKKFDVRRANLTLELSIKNAKNQMSRDLIVS